MHLTLVELVMKFPTLNPAQRFFRMFMRNLTQFNPIYNPTVFRFILVLPFHIGLNSTFQFGLTD